MTDDDAQARRRELEALFNDEARIARTFGMRLSFASDGTAVLDLPYNRGLDHAFGGIHGGVQMTMLDNAGWFTAAARQPAGTWVATSEMSTHLLRPAARCDLRATAALLKTGKRQDVCEMHLFDADGQRIAHATATFVVLPSVSRSDAP